MPQRDTTEHKDKVILLSSEGCGASDPDLGYAIVAQLFEALPQREDRPSAIIFWNTAVKLLADGSPLLSHLHRLEEKGVRLLAGKLCVNELGVTDKMAAGEVVGLGDILDIILHNEVLSL